MDSNPTLTNDHLQEVFLLEQSIIAVMTLKLWVRIIYEAYEVLPDVNTFNNFAGAGWPVGDNVRSESKQRQKRC